MTENMFFNIVFVDFSCGFRKKSYLCTVFFMVLDF